MGKTPTPSWPADRGVTHLNQEDTEAAIRDFTRVISLRPDDAVAHLNRGIALTRQERYEEAVGDFDRAGCASGFRVGWLGMVWREAFSPDGHAAPRVVSWGYPMRACARVWGLAMDCPGTFPGTLDGAWWSLPSSRSVLE